MQDLQWMGSVPGKSQSRDSWPPYFPVHPQTASSFLGHVSLAVLSPGGWQGACTLRPSKGPSLFSADDQLSPIPPSSVGLVLLTLQNCQTFSSPLDGVTPPYLTRTKGPCDELPAREDLSVPCQPSSRLPRGRSSKQASPACSPRSRGSSTLPWPLPFPLCPPLATLML